MSDGQRVVRYSVTVEAIGKTDVLFYAEKMAQARLGVESVRVVKVEPFPRELWPGGPFGYTFEAVEA